MSSESSSHPSSLGNSFVFTLKEFLLTDNYGVVHAVSHYEQNGGRCSSEDLQPEAKVGGRDPEGRNVCDGDF